MTTCPCEEREYRAAFRWLASDDTGISSQAIVCAALGVPFTRWGDAPYPHDPGDLGRCLRMLKRLPWAKRGIDKLSRRSPKWRALREHWKELHDLMRDEVGIDWSKGQSAPRTWDRMREIIG